MKDIVKFIKPFGEIPKGAIGILPCSNATRVWIYDTESSMGCTSGFDIGTNRAAFKIVQKKNLSKIEQKCIDDLQLQLKTSFGN